jgi:hypothetical protein
MKKIIVIVIILLGALFLAKDLIVKSVVSQGIKAITGLTLQVKSMHVGILKTEIAIKELKIFNPVEYTDRLMADVPEIYVNYDLGGFLKGKVHLKELKLNLREFVVVKDGKGEINFSSLQALQPKGGGKPPEIKIDKLKLDIGKVIYKDYTRTTQAKAKEFNVNIHDQYENINDPYSLVGLIITRALMSTTISKLAKFDLAPIKDMVNKTVNTSGQLKDSFDKILKKENKN